MNFLDDSHILKSHGDWHLVIYHGNRLAFASKDGSSIMTLGMAAEEEPNEDGTVSDLFYLLNWIGEEFFKSLNYTFNPVVAQEAERRMEQPRQSHRRIGDPCSTHGAGPNSNPTQP